MKEYIERDAVMQEFADYVKRSNNSDFAPTPTWNEAVQIVEDAPASDVVEVRHGRWIDEPIKGIRYHCSICFGRFDYTWHYCPNCGAKMDGGAE